MRSFLEDFLLGFIAVVVSATPILGLAWVTAYFMKTEYYWVLPTLYAGIIFVLFCALVGQLLKLHK